MRIFTIQEDPLPEFEVDEKPEAVAVVLETPLVFRGKPFDASGIEESAVEGPGAENELFEDRPERSAEPAPERHGETHLAACEDWAWHEVA